jgi:hypothetical protein
VRRGVLAGVPAALVAGVAVALPELLRARLPADGFHHLSGEWIDHTSWGTLTRAVVVGAVGALALAGGILVGARHALQEQRMAVVVAWTAAAGALGYSAQAVVRDLDLPAGVVQAAVPWWAAPPVAVTALAVAAVSAWWAAGPTPLPAEASPHRYGVHAGPRSGGPAWCRTVDSRGERWAAAGWAAAAVLVAVLDRRTGWDVEVAVLGTQALLAAARSRVRVVVDADGMRVVHPALRRTVLAVRHADVVAATASRLDPASLPSRTSGLLRAEHVVGYRTRTDGPALRLQLSSGRQVVLTLPARWPWRPTRSTSTSRCRRRGRADGVGRGVARAGPAGGEEPVHGQGRAGVERGRRGSPASS